MQYVCQCVCVHLKRHHAETYTSEPWIVETETVCMCETAVSETPPASVHWHCANYLCVPEKALFSEAVCEAVFQQNVHSFCFSFFIVRSFSVVESRAPLSTRLTCCCLSTDCCGTNNNKMNAGDARTTNASGTRTRQSRKPTTDIASDPKWHQEVITDSNTRSSTCSVS